MKLISTGFILLISLIGHGQFKGQLLNKVASQANDGYVSLVTAGRYYVGLCHTRYVYAMRTYNSIKIERVPGLSSLLLSVDSARIKPPVLFNNKRRIAEVPTIRRN